VPILHLNGYKISNPTVLIAWQLVAILRSNLCTPIGLRLAFVPTGASEHSFQDKSNHFPSFIAHVGH
jgi:phosphoketolase